MSPVTPRQSDILSLARRLGRVDVDGLAAQFEVTPQTIRKDLNDLCDRNLLQRVHGGAIHPSNVTNLAYDSRRVLAAEAKARIGRRAASLIPDHSSIIMNIGTTTEEVAKSLLRHDDIMVVTNSINVAHILRESRAAQVIVAGGVVRATDGGIVGEATVAFMRQFKADFAVIGTSAIDADGTLLDYDYREVSVAREIIRLSRTTILVADAMKFERKAPVRIAPIAEIDVFVTDRQPPRSVEEAIEAGGVRLEIAEPEPGEEAAASERDEAAA
jgi:DeoR family glycerol-3-phosphate regulon repressor